MSTWAKWGSENQPLTFSGLCAAAEAMLLSNAGYTGPNVKLGDYYVREVERVGSEHRQVVRYEVVGVGRIEQTPRSRWERQARAA